MAPEVAPPPELASLQKRFADHIRNPEHCPAPDGIEQRRLAIYRRLFFNNLSSLFGANFNIARKILADDDWNALIRAFMIEHRPTTPQFPEIGREFVRFLAEHPEHYETRWPWLAELCHWQFQATGVRNDEAEPTDVDADPDGDLVAAPPVLNPTLRLAQYRWPVNTIRADKLPEVESPVILAIWRKRDDHLGRMKINAVTARLLELVQENPTDSGQSALEKLAGEIQHPDPEAMRAFGADLLQTLNRREALLGTRR